ncbi:MAG TPA: glycosyltransferase [Thiotrichaceae bacterium]|nr:glycosyltransferase [Thiotrichaceae bacterium]
MKPINIFHLTTAFVVGGAEKVILDLSTHSHSDFHVQVIALSHNDDMLSTFIEQGIKAHKLDMKKSISSFFQIFKRLDKVVAEDAIDIIHVHLFHPLPLALLLKLKHPRLKIFFTSHSTDIGGKHRELLTWISKRLRYKDIIFSQDMMSSIYRKDTVIINNGVDVAAFNTFVEKNSRFTFISVGTIRPEKNQLHLVDCAYQLKKKGYDFDINIVGGGVENDELIQKIQQAIIEKGVSDCVHMLGVRKEIPQLLKQSHCLVLPSLFEGMPLVLLEAGAAKLPIIATPVGSIPKLLEPTMGFVSQLDQFCEQMEKVLNNYTNAETKATLFLAKVEASFSIHSVVRSHELLYRKSMK